MMHQIIFFNEIRLADNIILSHHNALQELCGSTPLTSLIVSSDTDCKRKGNRQNGGTTVARSTLAHQVTVDAHKSTILPSKQEGYFNTSKWWNSSHSQVTKSSSLSYFREALQKQDPSTEAAHIIIQYGVTVRKNSTSVPSTSGCHFVSSCRVIRFNPL